MHPSAALAGFSAATRSWFEGAFAAPTAAQSGAWEAIRDGRHTLVVAPTGSGKTLAAFLWSIDRLITMPASLADRRCRVVYVSPLKALAVDVERNLRAPLIGIGLASARLGLPPPDVHVGRRSGDTPAVERRAFLHTPPDILITTPESLFLLLTSRARESLRGVQTVIVDEVHAVAGTKRGAHLALSLERLDALLERPAQRVGLSATVRPVDEVARFLAGGRDVAIVQAKTPKRIELQVIVPVEDMASPKEPAKIRFETEGSGTGDGAGPSIWPAVESRIVDLVEAHRATIVFANSRRLAERLCSRLNEIAYERQHLGGLAEAAAPAELMAQAGASRGAPDVIARAHHGSVSREQRATIEEALKAGQLPAVVATSSLELGIDMGAVDLVVQVESPPSVGSGLQRIGRAGHHVDAVSRGVIVPKYRGDLVQSAVVAERMRDGAIEALRYPRNPLDVLAQQIVAMVAMDPWRVDDLGAVVRRAAPFAGLPHSALEATLDMLAGRYPSDDFAELRPRVVWDRVAGTLTARPGAQRLAVTSGGTIPDRGLFGVFLAGDQTGSRVGELDEEMVYESRVGDVFTLGSSSWRIEDITHDRVLVSPAPGQPGKLPFWHGDAPGRPLELGRAVGAFLRELSRLEPARARARAEAGGLDAWAAGNVVAYLLEQQAATGHLPDDLTVLVERFRDELGDWRLAVHSPFGGQVNAPWALALTARLRERYGVDVQSMHSDDGIIVRLPDTEEPPDGTVAVFTPEEVEALVQAEVGGSALFASRFRECAARALLLPRRNPARRTPLWQQRQRGAQLLSVAARFGGFPIVLETMRECLQDVFDVPGLMAIMRDVQARRVRLVEAETATPSPFARSLLFGYVGAFMYEGDAPLAERRAQALSLDSTLLAELLGQAELRDLLDADALEEVEQERQRRTDSRRAYDVESSADLLRAVGDLTTGEAIVRGATPHWLAELEASRRAIRVRIAGEERWLGIEDAARVRDALGVPLPVGVPQAFLEPVPDPLGDLIGRYARTHGPFLPADVARRFGLGVAVVDATLTRLATDGRVVRGEFRPDGVDLEWCDVDVLRSLRRRSLARLCEEVEPVPPGDLARFAPAWQQLGGSSGRGAAALLRAVEQLQGAAVPASALETLVLPARVRDYSGGMLDELCVSGEVLWAGLGALPGSDGWVSLYLADAAALLLPAPEPDLAAGFPHAAVLTALEGGAALFFRDLSERVAVLDDTALVAALWELVWGGYISNDTIAPLRALSARRPGAGGARSAPRLRSGRRPGLGRPPMPSRAGPPTATGRWSLLPRRDPDPTRRAHATAEVLLDRHGIVTRGAVVAERVPGGFAGVYPVFKTFEENGRCRRGYFVDGLGAAQFAVDGAVDRLRALTTPQPSPGNGGAARGGGAAPGGGGDSGLPWLRPAPRGHGWPGLDQASRRDGGETLVLAAADPANPYGAALPWPDRAVEGASEPGGHRPGRKAGALVVLVDGALVLYVERGGRSLLSWTDEPTRLRPAVDAIALAVRDGGLGHLAVERADGTGVLSSPLGRALEEAGFRPTPRGLRLRA